ncbi:hypothetical protein GF336_02970 [Candidatus Woesearchaeota archaeon]|nr:hypothetical protein [Candidatus Woesearchaeota archaeon]
MIIPKKVIDDVCSDCINWKKTEEIPYYHCTSYARECNALMDYSFKIAQEANKHEKTKYKLEQ